MAQDRRFWLGTLLLVCAVLLTYSPALKAGFFWDDGAMLASNPVIVGPLGLKEIWTTQSADICPLTLTTFWLEHAAWGLNPLPYHLVTLALHAACAVLLWRVLLALRIPGAWFGAALWALHPVQVESVAWVVEMKNTESGVFFLLSILSYLQFLETETAKKTVRGGRYYWLALVCAALALLAKPSTVGLPIVLVLCEWWLRHDWQRRWLLRLIPFALLSAVAAVLALCAYPVRHVGADPQWQLTWAQHLAIAGDSFWFYLGKLAWPYPVDTIYARWKIDASDWLSYIPLLLACTALTTVWLYRKTWARSCFFALAYFFVMVLPVLGLFNQFIFRYSFVFDHFQYLASMGPLVLVAAGLTQAGASVRLPAPLTSSICGLILLMLAALSFRQAALYRDPKAHWTFMVSHNPECWLAYNELGNIALRDGDISQAAALYQKSVDFNPNFATSHSNLGIVYSRQGRLGDALAEHQRALALDPNDAEAHNNLGETLEKQSRLNDAMTEFQRALAINPYYDLAHFNLGSALAQVGADDAAIGEYQRALQANPKFVVAYLSLGMAQLHKGDGQDAFANFQRALQIDPNSAEAWNDVGWVLFLNGNPDAAIADYQQAIALNPGFTGAYNNLGWAYLQGKADPDDAIVQFQRVLVLEPTYTVARTNLAAAYARKGQYDQAILQFQAILQANPNDADAKKNLAAVQAVMKSAHKPTR